MKARALGLSWADIAYVNQAHPFREGDGRMSKQFMDDLAEGSPFRFEFDGVTPEQWNQASAMSRPDLDKHAPDSTSLVPVFNAISVDAPAPSADPLADVRAIFCAATSGFRVRRPGESTKAASSRPRRAPATCLAGSRR